MASTVHWFEQYGCVAKQPKILAEQSFVHLIWQTARLLGT